MPADDRPRAAGEAPAGATEPFRLGARVLASDGECGTLERVVVDPVAQALTHLVVLPRHHRGLGRLVPVGLVGAADRGEIHLRCSRAGFEALDDADDIQFLPPTTDWFGYGQHALAWPFYGAGLPLGEPRHHAPIFTDRVPAGDVEVRRGDPVQARDGLVGAVQGLVIDQRDHRITHVLLKEGHLWGSRQVAIPIAGVSRVADEIRVELSKQEIEQLAPVELSASP